MLRAYPRSSLEKTAVLAVLEMARLRLLRVFQAAEEEGGAIVVEARETLGEGSPEAGSDYR